MRITIRVITGDCCSKSDSKEEVVRSFALRVDEAIRTERQIVNKENQNAVTVVL